MAQVFDKDLQTEVKVGRIWPGQTGAPGAANDQAHGYRLGDVWINTAHAVYMCVIDTPAGGAVWTQLG